jgi:hypothetical protein
LHQKRRRLLEEGHRIDALEALAHLEMEEGGIVRADPPIGSPRETLSPCSTVRSSTCE